MNLCNRSDSVLLIVDTQEGFYPDRRTDVDRPAFDAFFDRVAWVAGMATALDVPIVATEEDAARAGPTSERVMRHLTPSSAVLPKPVFAVPENPPILAALEHTSRRTIVIVGMETDVCVSHSAISLLNLGYGVLVVKDATFSPGQAHLNGIERLGSSGAELLSAKELFYDWTRTLDAVYQFADNHPDLTHPPGFSL